MSREKIEFVIVISGIVITGSYAIVTGQADGIAATPIELLIVTALGTVGIVIEQTWESTILELILAAVIGGTIGVLVTSETLVELLFAFLSGCLFGMITQRALETWRSESSPELVRSG